MLIILTILLACVIIIFVINGILNLLFTCRGYDPRVLSRGWIIRKRWSFGFAALHKPYQDRNMQIYKYEDFQGDKLINVVKYDAFGNVETGNSAVVTENSQDNF